MPAVKTVKTINVTDNYLLLQNTDVDKVIIINRLEPPDNVWEGYVLYIDFDGANKGGGIFLKNKAAGDATGNLRLNCYGKKFNDQRGILSSISNNALTDTNKLSVGHIIDALIGIRDANNALRDAAITAAIAANYSDSFVPFDTINIGGFAYGLGGADFNAGHAVGDTQTGTTYYDYTYRPPMVKLVWDGSFWIQPHPLGFNALS